MTVRAELCRFRPLARLKVLILVQTMEVSNELPTEAEVYMEVRGLRTGIEGGLSRMIAEDLKGRQKETKRKKYQVGRRWELVEGYSVDSVRKYGPHK